MRLLLAAVALAAAFSGTARAATLSVSVEHEPGDGKYFDPVDLATLNVKAAPGETNRLVIDHPPGRTVTIRDGGAKLVAGWGCGLLPDGAAVCSTDAVWQQVFVDAGDGDDSVTVTGIGGWVLGGAGDDVLTGGSDLHGGTGDDTLSGAPNQVGGPGRDHLTGTPGNDILLGDGEHHAPLEADVIDGGDGYDLVSYASSPVGVKVDLALPTASDDDVLKNVEALSGGPEDDVLRGNAIDNVILGGGGQDVLDGRAGHDVLDGNAGDDRLLTDASDHADCGSGTDLVQAPQPTTVVSGCERLRLPSLFIDRLSVGSRVRFTVRRTSDDVCRLNLDDRSVRLDDGRAHAVSLPLQRITLRGASCGAATGGRVLGGFAPER